MRPGADPAKGAGEKKFEKGMGVRPAEHFLDSGDDR